MNKILISTLLGFAFTANAQAGPLTVVDPDSFANGVDISNATQGVFMNMKFGNPVYSFETGDANYASTGTKVFGYDAGFGVEPYWDNQNIFRAFFSSSAIYVAIDVINNNGAGQGTDTAYMQVFGTSGLLATIASNPIGFPGHQTLEYQSGSSIITRIELSSLDGSDFNLDRLQFQVPEPGSLVLMGIGLLGYLSRHGRFRLRSIKCVRGAGLMTDGGDVRFHSTLVAWITRQLLEAHLYPRVYLDSGE